MLLFAFLCSCVQAKVVNDKGELNFRPTKLVLLLDDYICSTDQWVYCCGFRNWISGNVVVDFPWLIPLGLVPGDFASSDYFPLLSNLGFFLAGAFLGKTLYRKKETLLPRVNPANPVLAFFTLLGKWSLPVYLLHQPIITGLLYLILEIL